MSWGSLIHFDGLYYNSNCYFFSFERRGSLWCTSSGYTIVVPNGHRTKVIWVAILFSRFKESLKEIIIWHLLEDFFVFCIFFTIDSLVHMRKKWISPSPKKKLDFSHFLNFFVRQKCSFLEYKMFTTVTYSFQTKKYRKAYW